MQKQYFICKHCGKPIKHDLVGDWVHAIPKNKQFWYGCENHKHGRIVEMDSGTEAEPDYFYNYLKQLLNEM